MSTVLYAFRASDDENLSEQIGIAKFLAKDLVYAKPEGIVIQVFHTSSGIVYRVLEAGYRLFNKMWRYPYFFPQCNYDNRADIPESDTNNEKVADEIDRLILSGQCFLVPILHAATTEPNHQTAFPGGNNDIQKVLLPRLGGQYHSKRAPLW